MSEEESQLNNFLSQFGLSQESLQEQCDETLFRHSMHEIPSFEDAAPFFFTVPEIQSIQYDCSMEQLRRLQMLEDVLNKSSKVQSLV